MSLVKPLAFVKLRNIVQQNDIEIFIQCVKICTYRRAVRYLFIGRPKAFNIFADRVKAVLPDFIILVIFPF